MSANTIDHGLPAEVDSDWKIGIVYAPYYKEEVEAMVEGANRTLQTAGIPKENISLHSVTGSFEIPLIGSALTESKKVDALIGLGIILQGETTHADHIAAEVARGMMDIQVRTQTPFALGVLHVQNLAVAAERCFGNPNRGEECAQAVLHSLAELQRLRS